MRKSTFISSFAKSDNNHIDEYLNNEIEDVIASHPKVLEVGAIGVPDKKSTEAVKVYIVKQDESLTNRSEPSAGHGSFRGLRVRLQGPRASRNLLRARSPWRYKARRSGADRIRSGQRQVPDYGWHGGRRRRARELQRQDDRLLLPRLQTEVGGLGHG